MPNSDASAKVEKLKIVDNSLVNFTDKLTQKKDITFSKDTFYKISKFDDTVNLNSLTNGLTIMAEALSNTLIYNLTFIKKSRTLKDFVKEIQYTNRNPQDNSVLRLLDDLSTNPAITIKSGEFLFRARIANIPEKINKKSPFWGYSKEESFIPPRDKTRDMRANYRYIPYLYCSNSPDIALCEVRPRLGSFVSIASIVVNQALEIFDLTLAEKPTRITQTKINLCDDLSKMFAKPVTIDDDVIDYIPTQYIAEYIKKLGYDGIKYHSAFNNDGSKHANFVIFNYSKCEAVRSNVFLVDSQKLHCKKNDEDDENIFEKADK